MKITILGAGKLGSNIAQALLHGNHDITVIDENPDVIDKLSSRLDLQCINANAKSIETLKDLQVDKSDVLIACMDSDDKNLVLASLAKTLGVKKCIARIGAIGYIDDVQLIKKTLNIDQLINPDYTSAIEIYKHLVKQSSFADDFEIINRLAVLKFTASNLNGLDGGLIKDTYRLLNGLLLAAISRNGKLIIPSGNTEILADDVVYAIGSKNDASNLRKKLAKEKSANHLNNVMIAGGGKTAICLAQLLSEDDIDIKIIENDRNRCKDLADKFPKVSVIYGDATDRDLLAEEEISQMDAFVACTGLDEVNILIALTASKENVKNVVAKMSHKSYAPIIEELGNTMTINPVDLCTANVIRYINEDKNVVFSKMIQGQAEFTDIVVESDMPVAGKTLSSLKLPEGILIGAITRGDKLIIPNGLTEVQAGDKLTVLSLLSKVPELERLVNKDYVGEF